jgi:hypothetical protein
MVAGADGMGKTAVPKYHTSANVRVVLSDVAAQAGERISATANAGVLSRQLRGWTIARESIGAAVGALVDRGTAAGTSWRMLADGTLWVGPETWPDSGLKDPDDFTEMEGWPHEGRVELGVDAPKLLPGTLLGGRRVSTVEHTIRDGHVRTRVLIEG